MAKKNNTLKEAIWHLNGFIEYFESQPILTPEEEAMLDSAKNFVEREKKKLKGVV